MPWSVRFDVEHDVIEVVYAGLLSASEFAESFPSIQAEGAAHGTRRLLADCRGVEGGHSFGDLFFLAEAVSAAGIALREAVLLPTLASLGEHVAFWETTARNRGLEVSLFEDREAALRWLHA